MWNIYVCEMNSCWHDTPRHLHARQWTHPLIRTAKQYQSQISISIIVTNAGIDWHILLPYSSKDEQFLTNITSLITSSKYETYLIMFSHSLK